MKKGIRITIDGAANTGKTLLAYAFSEFLRQNGVEDEQISFFNDGMPPREECQSILETAIANGVFKDTEFAFVERQVGRPYLVSQENDKPVGTLLSTYLDAGAVRRKYAKQHMFNQMNKDPEVQERMQVEEIKRQALLDEMLKDPQLAVLLNEFRIVSVDLLLDYQDAFLGYRKEVFPDNDALPTIDVFIGRWDNKPVTTEDVVRLYTALKPQFPEIHLTRKLQNSGISGAHAPGYGSTPLFNPKAHSALTQAGRDALQAMTSEQVRASSPILETLPEFTGIVRGRPWGADNGDHNGELESGYIYRQQIHPLTGETRDQMLVRATPYVRTAHLGGHLAQDYSNLPADLTFDNKCGIRWKTTAEMAQLQAEVDAVFEQAHDAPLTMSKEYQLAVYAGLPAQDQTRLKNGEFGELLVVQLRLAGHSELMQKFTLHDFINISDDEVQQRKWNGKRMHFINRGTDREFHKVKFLAEFKPADGVTDVQPYIGQLVEAVHQCRPEVLAYVTYPTGRWIEQNRKLVNQAELDQYPGIGSVDSMTEWASEEEQRSMTEGRSPFFRRLPGGVAPVASPADPVIKAQMDEVQK